MTKIEKLRLDLEAAQRRIAELEPDAKRFDWVAHKISGKEWRRIGIVYTEGATLRSAIDAALAEGKE